jgi:hypothetical protein
VQVIPILERRRRRRHLKQAREMETRRTYPLIFCSDVRPEGRNGQRCRKLVSRNVPSGVTRVQFWDDGEIFLVDERSLKRDSSVDPAGLRAVK